MRIDAHQHFWQFDPAEHTWMTDPMSALRRDFLPQDLEPLLRSLDFIGSIAVQARQSLEETRWLLQLAEQSHHILGVVGWLDLCSPNLPRQLDRFGRHRKLVGVRHVLQDEPDDDFMLRPRFLEGIAQLRSFGLVYDLLIRPRQLLAASELVRRFPAQRFVLDHIAKPEIRRSLVEPWRDDLGELARSPNVFCKLSGMVTEAAWCAWKPQDFYIYLDTVFEAFTPHRLMIGSDWPVCTLSGNYVSTMRVVIDYLGQFPPEVQAGILGGNCAAFYGLAL